MKSLSFPTKLYLLLTYMAGISIFIFSIMDISFGKPWLLIVLCVLASLALILKVEGSTNRSHYTFSFLVYGFTFALFGVSETILVIVVSNIVEWIWNRPPWFIQLFNAGSYVLVTHLSGFAYAWINPAGSPNTFQAALAIIVSMALFNLLNHIMVGIVVSLARGEGFKKSGVFDFFPLMLDLTLLYFGASLSFVWNYNPFALGLFLIPLYLIYSTLRVPALERKTETDSKTGLFNHEYMKKQLENELVRANRFDRPLSVIMADLDLLRNINNTYGHLAGDEVLIGVAKILKSSVREYDVVARFGGEEFAILLPETTLSQAYERAEIIRKAIEKMEFTVPTSVTPICATMSFGVAHRESFGQTADEIVHNADTALYHSKLSGRNRAFAYTNEMFLDLFSSSGNSKPVAMPVGDVAERSFPSSSKPVVETKVALEPKTKPRPQVDVTVAEAEKPQKRTPSNLPANLFIGSLALVSVTLFSMLFYWISARGNLSDGFDWTGMVVIVLLIALSEWFSIDLYVHETSVSTSAIPILVAYLIFGPIGTLFASLTLAVSLAIKYRSAFNRFVFNFSNHLLAGTFCLGLLMLTGEDYLYAGLLFQISFTLICVAILYLTTTWMIAIGMSLSQKQGAWKIWKEQYRWLAPLYGGIGLISYAMIFGYRYDHIGGILLMVVPMVLLRLSQKQYLDRTRGVVTELREKNQILKKTSDEIVELNDGLLETLSEIIDLRDPYVLGHSKQVSFYATEIAKVLKLNDKQIELIRKGGLLHDIGKLGIPEPILAKPTRLTLAEYENIKRHAALGAELVEKSPSLRPLIPIIRHHHEFYDGNGYPDRLKGNQISIEARVVAVSDAIEAMSSDRNYRKALKPEKVLEEIKKYSGTQFDPVVVEAAVKVLERLYAEKAVNEIDTKPLSVIGVSNGSPSYGSA